MPKININYSSRRAPTRTGRRQANAEDFGAAAARGQETVGRSLTNLSNTAFNVTMDEVNRRNTIRDKEFIAAQTVKLSEEADAIFEEERMNGLDGLNDRVKERSTALFESALQAAPSDNARASIQGIVTNKTLNLGARTKSYIKQEQVRSMTATYEQSLGALEARLMRNPGALDEVSAEYQVLLDSLDGITSPEDRERLGMAAQDTLTYAYVKGQLQNDPKAVLAEIEEGAYDDLGADKVERITRDANRAIEYQANQAAVAQQREHEKYVAELSKDAIRGVLTESDVVEKLEDGILTSKEAGALITGIRSTNKAAREKKDAIAEVVQFFEDNTVLDPGHKSDRKKLDTYYTDVVVPHILEAETVEDGVRMQLDFIRRANGYIPAALRKNIVTTLEIGTPEQQLSQAQFVDNLARELPEVYGSFSDSQRVKAQRLATAAQLGIPPEEAVSRIQAQAIEPHMEEYKQRVRDFDKNFPEFNVDSIDAPGIDFFTQPDVPQEMMSDWRRLAKLYAVDYNMDFDGASDLAYKTIQSTYGISKVTGSKAYVKFPPEQVFTSTVVDGQRVRLTPTDVRDAFEKNRIQAGLPEDIVLTTDPRSTKDDVRYFAAYDDEFGIRRVAIWEPDFEAVARSKIHKATSKAYEDRADAIGAQELSKEINQLFLGEQ